MNSNQKIVQYLDEAHASEVGLVRVLQSQIAMTPRGTYRTALERHLGETRGHARRVEERLRELGHGGNPLLAGLGLAETVIAQAVAIGKTPFDLVRGTGGEEKVLKNAKDAAATEALEIATYTAIERLARGVGDDATAELAASIRSDEEKMLERVLREIPKLTDDVARAELDGESVYDVTETGAADAVKTAARATRSTARKTAGSAKRTTARTARSVPGAARAEGTAKGAVASEQDLPIAGYDGLTADDIARRLPQLSQVELVQVETYERKGGSRATVLERIDALRASEPWSGYDGQNVEEIRRALGDASDATARTVREYERAHKNRAGVLDATARELATA